MLLLPKIGAAASKALRSTTRQLFLRDLCSLSALELRFVFCGPGLLLICFYSFILVFF